MTKIWKFAPWLPYEIGLEKLVANCSFLNAREVYSAGHSSGQFRQESFPVAQLKLTIEGFDVDCFEWESRTLVSERMRRAMALKPSEIQFFDVDASQSAPGPRSKNYQIMNVPLTEDASDASRSDYTWGELVPGSPPMVLSEASIAIRMDAKPTHDLFHDQFFLGHRFCTDAFAVRVLQAGCAGVRFLDPAQLSIGKPMRFRSLRGIEEEGEWDPVQKIEHTKLVEAIN